MSIEDCSFVNLVERGKCRCGSLYSRNRDKKDFVKGFGYIPFLKRLKNPKICAAHKKRPWCGCRGYTLCGGDVISMCRSAARRFLVEGEPMPSWVKEWIEEWKVEAD